MVYNPGIPLLDDLLSNSQGQLLENFDQLNVVFGHEHVPFNNGVAAERGKHTQIIEKMLLFGAATPVTTADEGAIFTQDAGRLTPPGILPIIAGGRTELFYKYSGGAAAPIMQLSAIKAWVIFTGNVGTPCPIGGGYNVAQVNRTGLGVFSVVFTTGLRTSNNACFITSHNAPYCVGAVVGGSTANYVVEIRSVAGGVLTDPVSVAVLIIGD